MKKLLFLLIIPLIISCDDKSVEPEKIKFDINGSWRSEERNLTIFILQTSESTFTGDIYYLQSQKFIASFDNGKILDDQCRFSIEINTSSKYYFCGFKGLIKNDTIKAVLDGNIPTYANEIIYNMAKGNFVKQSSERL